MKSAIRAGNYLSTFWGLGVTSVLLILKALILASCGTEPIDSSLYTSVSVAPTSADYVDVYCWRE